jgi:hypothetical protein
VLYITASAGLVLVVGLTAAGAGIYDPTWAKLVRTFGVDRGECMADVFG